METSLEVREHIVRALRLDLVGPQPGHEHEAEVITEPPDRWYLTGYLVPFQARQASADPTEDETVDSLDKKGGSDDDETPEKPSGRRGHFPSSMGLSVLLHDKTVALEVTADWGDYAPLYDPPAEGAPEPSRPSRWRRRQRSERLSVPLPAPGKRQAHDVPDSDGMQVVVHARPLQGELAQDHLPGARTVSVFLVNNRTPSPDSVKAAPYAFQARLTVETPSGAPGFLARPNLRGVETDDDDERVADLQYRDKCEWAVGHNVSTRATVVEADGAQRCAVVCTEWIPTSDVEKTDHKKADGVAEVGMEALAECETASDVRAHLEGMVAAYTAWIAEQRATRVDGAQRQQVLAELMDEAERARDRIEAGFEVLEHDERAFAAFRLANRVMARQARQTRPDDYDDKGKLPRWRLFQVAFLLMNLRGVADPECAERETVDLIFFPTGGGKTEAYLGLAAFTLVYRRLTHPGLGAAGVSVLMRYTLRLLTLDQLARASALICALELERQAAPDELGKWPFEIGLWVGSAATPNRMGHKGDKSDYSARTRVRRYKSDKHRYPVPIPLDRCPWCQTAFDESCFHLVPDDDRPRSLRIGCRGRRCAFSRGNYLPVVAVDDEIYRRLPCFLIATVDKFAAMPWTGEVGGLFGRVSRYDEGGFYGPCDEGVGRPLEGGRLPPPDLIIQDELHLISGPLGTVSGLYEAAIEALCTVDQVKPKLVASTATVRRARSQIRSLFARSDVQVFPPPGPDLRDSFFAQTKRTEEVPGRRYIGVAAQGRSGKVMLHRVYLAVLSAAERAWQLAGGEPAPGSGATNPADPYMTLLGYFNALRELGGSRRIVEDEVMTRLRGYGTRTREGEKKGLLASRRLKGPVVELTSRVSTTDVSRVKDRLRLPFPEDQRVDVALATNMISVGLDITRLGLMVVMGQPKTTAEYIQATSRVGRDPRRPGLVITLLNVHKPRDRSHYERFEHYHQTFYRSVEATSVTPFSPRAVDRSLAGVTVALARLGCDRLTPPRGAAHIWDEAKAAEDFVSKVLGERAEGHALLPPEDAEALRKQVTGRARNLLGAWKKVADHQSGLGGLQYQREVDGPARLLSEPLDPELERKTPKVWQQFKAHRSLRDVEPMVNLWVKNLDESEPEDDDASVDIELAGGAR